MTYKLTASKTKFYALAKHYWPEIGSMRDAEFTKAYRCNSYWLRFKAGEYWHKLYLSTCAGSVMLGDDWSTCNDNCNETKGWEAHRLSIDELREFGLLEEIPDLKEA